MKALTLLVCIYKSHSELQRAITFIELAPSPCFFIISICPEDMNVFARFDEIRSMALQDIKETKCYGRTDNVKTVNPPKTQFAGVK